MQVLFIFLDGIGLGKDDVQVNPLARANMPHVRGLLEGRALVKDSAPFVGEFATLLDIDAAVGVKGLPQSATGQAVLLTGKNIPLELGYHYGPKPNPEVAAYLNGETLFSRCVAAGKKAALLNAYPPRYFEGIDSGRRLYSSIPLAVTNAGLPLFTEKDLYEGRALSADFTGEGWRTMLGFADAPLMSPQEAGRKLASLARDYDFSLFEYWASDYAGHKQQMETAVRLMEAFDGVMGGLMEELNTEGQRLQVGEGRLKDEWLVLVTSDHGNMEDVSTRKHTQAHVPLLVIGSKAARETFTRGLTDLTHIAPALWRAVMEEAGGEKSRTAEMEE